MKEKAFRILIYAIFIAAVLLFKVISPQKNVLAIDNMVTVPANDNIENAETLTSPFELFPKSFSTAGASFQAGIDPMPVTGDGCDIDIVAATIWYKYAPASATAISIETVGSDYDTFIAIWRGPDSGITSSSQLTLVACNDDSQTAILTSKIVRKLDPVPAGTTYYIEIGEYVISSQTSGLKSK